MGTAGGYKVAPGVSLCCPRSAPGTHWGESVPRNPVWDFSFFCDTRDQLGYIG